MTGGNPINMPETAAFIIKTLNDAGFQAFIVGGCVRDTLLGKAPKDWDIATSARPEEVRALFPGALDTGAAHGTLTVRARGGAEEVTTYRVDGSYSDGRHPDSVTFTDQLTEDLRRRDFTMNAIAYHPAAGIVDPFGGAADVAAGIIRGVGDPAARFQEDALRMLRAVRFCAQLGFEIEQRTYQAIVDNAPLIAQIPENGRSKKPDSRSVSIERVRDEFLKIILSDKPERLSLLMETGLMQYISEKTAGYFAAHLESALPFLKACGKKLAHRLSLLFLRMTPEDCRDTLVFFRMDGKAVKETVLLAEWTRAVPPDDDYAVRRAVGAAGGGCLADALSLRRIVHRTDAAELARLDVAEQRLAAVVRRGDCCTLRQLAINGGQLMRLGINDGRKIGETLGYLLDEVMRSPEKNNPETLAALARAHAGRTLL